MARCWKKMYPKSFGAKNSSPHLVFCKKSSLPRIFNLKRKSSCPQTSRHVEVNFICGSNWPSWDHGISLGKFYARGIFTRAHGALKIAMQELQKISLSTGFHLDCSLYNRGYGISLFTSSRYIREFTFIISSKYTGFHPSTGFHWTKTRKYWEFKVLWYLLNEC